MLSALFVGPGGDSVAALEAALETLLPAYGARGERLLDGSRILILDGHVTAGEQVLAAARLALALRTFVTVPTLVCTGRARVDCPRPLGELIERGVRGLSEVPADEIWLDEASAALLAARFEISKRAGSFTLLCERLGGEAPRTLLGQVTPFVGREREVDRLLGLCQEAIEDGAARVAVVVGNAGAGKSRLKFELVQRLRTALPGIRWLSAQGDAMRANAPFSVLTSMLYAWAELGAHDTLAIKQHKLSTRVMGTVTADRAELVTAFLGEMIGVPFGDASNPALAAGRRDPQLMSDRLLSSFLEWLEAMAVTGPLALLVEDLHWADAPSVRFLNAALSVLSERPFVLLAFARPEVRATFPALWSERGVFEVTLPKLSGQACERLLQSIGSPDLSVSIQQWMIERAEGNPFFLEELVRGLRGRTADRERLPYTILGIIQTRLDALGQAAKGLVRAGSVFGQAFQEAALKALLGAHVEDRDVEGGLRLLTEREVLFARGHADAREYVFRHALIRDAAYALLSAAERTLGHRLAAEWLEQHARAEPSLLADHFERGEVPARAAFWYSAAASAAFEADALPEVVRCGERAVRCGVDGERLGEVAALVAEAVSYAGQQADAIEWAARARVHAAPGGASWWRASQALAIGQLERGLREQAAQTIEAMIAKLPDPVPIDQAWVALAIVAGSAINTQLGDYGRRLLTLLEALPSAGLPARARGFLHFARALAVYTSSSERAIHELREAVVQFQQAGSLKDVLRAQVNLGEMLQSAGLLEEAEARAREGMALADKLGSRSDFAACLVNLAFVHFGRSQTAPAEQALQDALSIFGRLQYPRPESQCLAWLARALSQSGRFDEASELVDKARALSKVDPTAQALALAMSAEVDRQQGMFESALSFARDAMTLHQAHHLAENVALTWVALVEALLGGGQVDEARASLGGALVWLHARADTFANPDWRRAFLTQVPENARLMALGERLR